VYQLYTDYLTKHMYIQLIFVELIIGLLQHLP